ncbi:hypothetical protein EVJ58_g9757 [Rhodofomes roseus]|uniref:Uncharacterized protein n=1 Tax=Rhodofomes roseus TaxID=34475 RepID=A0A4Y9XRE3_9APHY|nr:hypothetical protein EVJ58_g9757 [Rhodofomes roseus]
MQDQTQVRSEYNGLATGRQANLCNTSHAYICPQMMRSTWRDLPSGYVQRMKVYKTLWARCLSRMQTLVHAIHAPVACEVALEIKSAYEDQLPGLPYHEIPVITLAAEPGSPIYADVVSQLESPSTVQGQERRDLLIHLHPSECPNLLSMMRAVVTGFTAQSGTESRENAVRCLSCEL